MSPDAFEGEAQNKSTDVYSFSIILHEILALTKPFRWISEETYRQRVIQNGERPIVHTSWPPSIQHILAYAWDPNERARPSMMHIHRILNDELHIATATRLSVDIAFPLRGRFERLNPQGLDSTSSHRKVVSNVNQGTGLGAALSKGRCRVQALRI